MFEKLEIIENFSAYKQKFPRGSIVDFIYNDNLVVGVIIESYCEGSPRSGNFKDYTVLILNEYNMPEYSIAWIKENDMTLISDDTDYGNKLIDYYRHTKVFKSSSTKEYANSYSE